MIQSTSWIFQLCQSGGMVDAVDSKSTGGNPVPVQVRPLVPLLKINVWIDILKTLFLRDEVFLFFKKIKNRPSISILGLFLIVNITSPHLHPSNRKRSLTNMSRHDERKRQNMNGQVWVSLRNGFFQPFCVFFI